MDSRKVMMWARRRVAVLVLGVAAVGAFATVSAAQQPATQDTSAKKATKKSSKKAATKRAATSRAATSAAPADTGKKAAKKPTRKRRAGTARSTRRIPVAKEGQQAPPPPVNQDSIDRANRMRDSIDAANRARQDSIARVEQMRQDSINRANRIRDSIAAAERARQDSIARAEQARRDSIARADSIAAAKAREGAGFHIGVGGGLSIPTGDASSYYKTGWNVTVPLVYDFAGNPFGIRVDGAFDRLTGKTNQTTTPPTIYTSINSYSLNGDLKLRFPLGSMVKLYLLGGVTLAKQYAAGDTVLAGTGITSNGFKNTFSDASMKTGFNAGGGLQFGSGHLSLFVESRYFSVPAPSGSNLSNVKFIPVIAGLMF